MREAEFLWSEIFNTDNLIREIESFRKCGAGRQTVVEIDSCCFHFTDAATGKLLLQSPTIKPPRSTSVLG